jgi:phosphoenolpyruvate carboxykinase (ATP)
MVLPHHTPYVTPHILHKHYAQAAEAEQHSNRMSPARAPTPTHH